CQQYNNDPRTF
nr:immunoglobulin light chain junction region [Macaca mulatta]MOW40798.1 immunoglobulin light chain junction region [Macaca mulatta]MOW41157.1 immunoglobulin light chain junction region [Macaca mulatta]MOW41480.1 immunoglobulin light chain junction region [Macaca mulatta]MOW41833.1 immunoglobulin light chain junction region [Macaca mulatta]